MKKASFFAILISLWPGAGLAQSIEDLVNDGKNTDNVTTQSMGYDRKSYSPLKQINKSNVKRLVPIWSLSLMNDMGELSAPVIYQDVMYAINGKWTFAIDIHTGRQIWRTPVEIEPGVPRAQNAFTRGAPTIYDGKLFRVTIDSHLVALDMKTGKQIWKQKFADWREGYYATGAPIVANGVLISGMAGGESTTRGFLDGWDPETGRKLWRRTTSRSRASLSPRPGRRTVMPGREGVGRPGARVLMTPSSISSIGAPAMRSPTIRDPVRVWTVCSRRVSSRSGRRPARSCAITNTRRTTSTTWMRRMSRSSPISKSAGSFAK